MALSNRFLSPRWHRQEPRSFYPASYEICRPSLHHKLDFVEFVHVRHSSSDLSSSNSVATRHSSSELGSALAAPSLGSAPALFVGSTRSVSICLDCSSSKKSLENLWKIIENLFMTDSITSKETKNTNISMMPPASSQIFQKIFSDFCAKRIK